MQVSGLDGVVVAQTEVSLVDGERGELIVRGRSLEQLESLTFEQMVELLWHRPAEDLGQARVTVAARLRPLLPFAAELAPVEWLRFALDSLPGPSPEEAAAALAMALVLRTRPQAQPRPELHHAADVARMLFGDDAGKADALRRYWVCVAEHGFNASTFTARVVASTGAPLPAAISAALGALQGPLHGGAPGPVLDMLDALKVTPDPAGWLGAKIAGGERLMGFGHRVYKVRDPRAEMLMRACSALPQARAELQFAQRLETNVEYYTALLLQAIGFDREEFTAVFACGRVLGWVAHIREQQQHGRLIRPTAEYVGPAPAATRHA
jgi:citrate synthase